jgi:hypothetical protein
MLKIIFIIIAVLIAAVLIYAATKPDTFRIARSTSTQSFLFCRVKVWTVNNHIFASPFEKGGLRGIYLKNLPQPLFFKEGRLNNTRSLPVIMKMTEY